MSTIKVRSVENANKWFATKPEVPYTIEKPRNSAKYQGSTFHPIKFNFPNGSATHDGWFSFKDVPISFVPKPLELKDGQTQFGNTNPDRLTLSLRISECGALGEFFEYIDGYWRTAVKKAQDEKKLLAGTRDNPKPIKSFITRYYSEKHKTKPNQPMDDPIVSLRIEFDKFSPNYPVIGLRNRQKTVIYDASTAFLNKEGKVEYKEAVYVDEDGVERPVTAKTFGKWVSPGDKIVSGKFQLNTACYSSMSISAPVCLRELVILPNSGIVTFADDDEEISPEIQKILEKNMKRSATDASPESPTKSGSMEASEDKTTIDLDELEVDDGVADDTEL